MGQALVTVICGAFDVPEHGPGDGKVLICEPDPDRAQELRQIHAGRQDLRVIPGMLAARDGQEARLTRYSLPGLRSLRASTPYLRRLFPGVKETAQDTVPLIRVADLEKHIGAAPCRFWLETGGEEPALLEALQDSVVWPQIVGLHLRAGQQPLFDGAMGAFALANVLRRMGFVLEEGPQDDPDLPLLRAVPDPVIQDLRRRLDQQGADLQRAQTDLASLQDTCTRQADALARAGARQEQAQLLYQKAQARHEQTPKPAPQSLPAVTGNRLDPAVSCNPHFQPTAYGHYLNMPETSGFVLLDTCSMPRSGLHFLRQSLSDILGAGFSFCEWYNEPGCCRRSPCALTAFSDQKPANSAETETDLPSLRLRMIKSHDFGLTDPLYPQGGALHRMVLVRDPLEILTSWWSLQALQLNADLLRRYGLFMQKINFRHEGPLVAQAHRILAQHGTLPDDAAVQAFLDKQAEYLGGFAAKWGRALSEDPTMGQAVPYQMIPTVLGDLLRKHQRHLGADVLARLEAYQHRAGDFTPRQDPFSAPSQSLRDQLDRCAGSFRQAAERVLEMDHWKLLRSQPQTHEDRYGPELPRQSA